MTRFKSPAILVCLLLVISCGQGPDSGPEPEDPAGQVDTLDESAFIVSDTGGVRHVHNLRPQWQGSPKVALEPVRIWGGLEETDSSYWNRGERSVTASLKNSGTRGGILI